MNGDAFNIPVGVVVKCDVDQSSMATGMAASVIDGLLHFDADTNTCLKMNGNITGTGALYICERATVTGWTLTTDKTYTYQVSRSLDVATVEDTLGAGYLDAVEELIEVAIDTENAARRAQGLNEMMPDAVQTFIETTKAALTLSQILTYVEATPGSFYHDTTNDVLYIHTSDSTDPAGKTITVIEPINRPTAGSEYRSYLLFNSTGTIAMTGTPVIRMYGWYPEREWTQLAADAAAGQNQIVLEHDQGFQAGDIIAVGSGNEDGVSVETAACVYTVTSYNSETKTVTLTANLGTGRLIGDYVARISKPVKIARSSGTNPVITTEIDNIVSKGVYFTTKFLQAPILSDGTPNGMIYNSVFKHCSSSAILCRIHKDTIISDCFFYNKIDPLLASVNLKIKRCIGININTLGQWMYADYVKDSIVQNSKYGVVMRKGLLNFKNCKFLNLAYMLYGDHCTFSNCVFSGIDTYEPDILFEAKFKDCVFKENENGWFNAIFGKIFNSKFEGVNEINNYDSMNRVNNGILESFDHNRIIGNYKAWCKGGKIETALDGSTILPGRLILTCESEDYPVFRDFQVLLPAHRTSTWQAPTRKSFSGGSVKMELIDPANDPLIDPTAAPLATYTLPDQADTNLPLKLGYKSDKAMLAILRVSAQNSTGTVEIDTRLIENRIQHGQ